MRMKLPGTSPPKVQKRYSAPSLSFLTTSRTSSLTITLVACLRVMGGGTFGAWVSTAFSSPWTVGSTIFGTLAGLSTWPSAPKANGGRAEMAAAARRAASLQENCCFMRVQHRTKSLLGLTKNCERLNQMCLAKLLELAHRLGGFLVVG